MYLMERIDSVALIQLLIQIDIPRSIEVGRNVCHGSDSVESAEKEIAHWFPEGVW